MTREERAVFEAAIALIDGHSKEQKALKECKLTEETPYGPLLFLNLYNAVREWQEKGIK